MDEQDDNPRFLLLAFCRGRIRRNQALVRQVARWILQDGEHREKAKDQLIWLSGKLHNLFSAIVLLRDGQRIWHHLAESSLTMRAFDTAFAEAYIRHIGDAALFSPGAYQIESVGTSLFAKIEGDHFDILGLPLLPLLAILREHGLSPLEPFA